MPWTRLENGGSLGFAVAAETKNGNPQPEGVSSVQQLLTNNRYWSEKISAERPDYFKEMAKGQQPEFFWIGCADARVLANFFTGTGPGDVFCHRNVGNIVMHTDMNCMSALEYSVSALGVKHVVVCGHYACGAVNAALTLPQKSKGIVNSWISSIRDVRNEYAKILQQLEEPQRWPKWVVKIPVQPVQRPVKTGGTNQGHWKSFTESNHVLCMCQSCLQSSRLCEANAVEQAFNACTAPAVQAAWAKGQELYIHAMIYDIATGRLRRLAGPISSIEQAVFMEDDYHERGSSGEDIAQGPSDSGVSQEMHEKIVKGLMEGKER
ncbi:hypothetical protein BSKO_02445 [Bryopsis sp. KO-2023]|nr:hypothetical protein BSKO_02445 [Bryopsis sp. KO-2023]